MNEYDALKKLKAGPVNESLKGPGSYSVELRRWYDQKFVFITWEIVKKFGFSQQFAEEITQVVLLKAVNNIDNIQSEFALKKWLNSVIQNTCIDEVRKKTYLDKNELKNSLDIPSVIKVSEVNGIKITEYSFVEHKNGSRKLKFDVLYSKSDDEYEKTLDELVQEFASDLDLYDQTPEVDLIKKEQAECINDAILEFEITEKEKAEALRLLMCDTPYAEIAIKLNKSPNSIREYISQCYKKFKLFAKPCHDAHKLA
jgi:RNA polymerase sigma factor (sigma-70 family)